MALLVRLIRNWTPRTISMVGITSGIFAVAVAYQVGDRPGGWSCAPDAPIQGHAIWHVLAAAALFIGIRTLEEGTPSRVGERGESQLPPKLAPK
jgi:hypothetical protein